MFEIFSVVSLLGVIYLLIWPNNIPSKRDLSKKENNGIYLARPKDLPQPDSVDPELQLLKDVIKSCELESWTESIKLDYSYGTIYDINIKNPTGTLEIQAMIRYDADDYEESERIRIVRFTIVDKAKGSLSYSENKIANILCLEFLWNKYIIPYHQSEHDDRLDMYMSIRDSIDSKLVTLRRDTRLDNILNKN